MSYEGYEEYLCKNGHHHEEDVGVINYGNGGAKVCPQCGAEFEFRHSVDQTNGYDTDYESTCEAPMEIVGFEDVWHQDHHGNKYATKLMSFRPVQNWDAGEEVVKSVGTYEIRKDIPNWPWVNIAEETARVEAEIAETVANRRWTVMATMLSGEWASLTRFEVMETHTDFAFTDDKDPILVFESREEADVAAAQIRLRLSQLKQESLYSRLEACCIDLRDFPNTTVSIQF